MRNLGWDVSAIPFISIFSIIRVALQIKVLEQDFNILLI